MQFGRILLLLLSFSSKAVYAQQSNDVYLEYRSLTYEYLLDPDHSYTLNLRLEFNVDNGAAEPLAVEYWFLCEDDQFTTEAKSILSKGGVLPFEEIIEIKEEEWPECTSLDRPVEPQIVLQIPSYGGRVQLLDFQQSYFDNGLSADKIIQHVKAHLPLFRRKLINAHKTMSSVSGGEENLFCLLETYKNDPATIEITGPLKSEFEKLFGSIEKKNISCPPVKTLDANIRECLSGSASIFCLAYGEYKATKAWYLKYESRLNAVQFLSRHDFSKQSQLEDLKNRIKQDKDFLSSRYGV